MLQSTHVYVATVLEKVLNPDNAPEFYLGATIPDVRYFANIPRTNTHFSREETKQKFPDAPQDFLLGYDMHLALDEYTIESGVRDEMAKKFPPMVQEYAGGTAVEVIIAMYSMMNLMGEEDVVLSKTYQSELKNIEVLEDPFTIFVQTVQKMVDVRSERVFSEVMMREPRLQNDKRLKKLYDVGTYIDENPLVRNYLLGYAEPYIDEFIEGFASSYSPSV